MARLDRLAAVKGVAQLGATIGRSLATNSSGPSPPGRSHVAGSASARRGGAGLSRGVPPQATYLFKHALIQDAAYQSPSRAPAAVPSALLRSWRNGFPKRPETQPELLAHHYTEAGLGEEAVVYWQRAGRRALERSAHLEAISHLTKGLEVLKTLPVPPTPPAELDLQTTLGSPDGHQGQWGPRSGTRYARAGAVSAGWRLRNSSLCCLGCGDFITWVGSYRQPESWWSSSSGWPNASDPALLLEARRALGRHLAPSGGVCPARACLEQSIALYDPQQHRTHAFQYARDPGIDATPYLAWTLWLAYPDQAVAHSAGTDPGTGHVSPFSLATALYFAAWLYQYRREAQTVQTAEATIALSTEQRFPQWLAGGMVMQGWALAA